MFSWIPSRSRASRQLIWLNQLAGIRCRDPHRVNQSQNHDEKRRKTVSMSANACSNFNFNWWHHKSRFTIQLTERCVNPEHLLSSTQTQISFVSLTFRLIIVLFLRKSGEQWNSSWPPWNSEVLWKFPELLSRFIWRFQAFYSSLIVSTLSLNL